MSVNLLNSKSSGNLVALLIDGDNVASSQIDQILAEAGKLGEVTVRRLYGKSGAQKHWKQAVSQHNLKPTRIKNTGRDGNGSDIALTVGAMDLFCNNNIRCFCIVAGDSDYMPLVQQLRGGGCEVLGIGGQHNTAKLLIGAYSKFVFIEHLSSSPQVNESSPMDSIAPKNVLADELKLTDLLNKSYFNASKLSKDKEWIPIWQLCRALSKLDANYKALLGEKSLTAVIKKRKNLFEIRQIPNGCLEVRLSKQEAEESSMAA